MRKLIGRTNIARSLDHSIGGLHPIVDGYSFFVEIDANHFEVHVVNVRSSTDRYQELVDRFIIGSSVRLDGQPDSVG